MSEEEKKKYGEEFEKDMQTLNANEMLNKYIFDKNDILKCLVWSLDPSKKAFFNDIKKICNFDKKILLVKYEIDGKCYWGLPEENE